MTDRLNLDILIALPIIITGLLMVYFAWGTRRWWEAIILVNATLFAALMVWRFWYVWDVPQCWFPKREVRYEQGMMVCPGQTVRVEFELNVDLGSDI